MDYTAVRTVPVNENNMPKFPIADRGFYAYVSDTEGNVLGLWEEIQK